LNVYYKNSRIKQYQKENRALRTETTINSPSPSPRISPQGAGREGRKQRGNRMS